GSDLYRLAGHDLVGRNAAAHRGRRRWWSTAQLPNHTALQTRASQIGGGRNRKRREVMIGNHIIRLEEAQSKVFGHIHVNAATTHEAEAAITVQAIGYKLVPARQSFNKRRKMFGAVG